MIRHAAGPGGPVLGAEVIVVGAGPVGLLIASELAAHGVQTVVLERNAGIVDQPKAGTIHARAAQLLRRRGYLPAGQLGGAPDALIEGSFHFGAQQRFAITSPLAEGWPVVGMWQAELEALLESVCVSRGVQVLRGREVLAVSQDAGGVSALVQDSDGAHALRAAWMVGADGGRGLVREATGVSAEEWPATMRGLVGRVRLGAADTQRLAGWHETPRGWTLVNPRPGGHSRLVTFEFGQVHAERRARVTLDELRSTAERIAGTEIEMADLAFGGRFSDFSRLATRYRAGRMLLAGDAAHVHFPVGGQGLNCGLQDGFNLAWKLAMVVRHGASEALLDTYESERRAAALAVIDYTRGQARAMDPREEAAAGRAQLLALAATPGEQQRLADLVSSQGTRALRDDGDPALVGTFLADRAVLTARGPARLSALLASGRALLLERADDGRALTREVRPWIDRVDHIVEAGGGDRDEDAPRAVLLRPDGYVAWAGDTPLGLRAALRAWFGVPRGLGSRSVASTPVL